MNKQLIWRIAKYLGIGILAAFIASILIGGSVFFYYASKAPELTESKLVATTSSKIYDSKNELICRLRCGASCKMLKVVKFQQILLMQLSLLKTIVFQPQRD